MHEKFLTSLQIKWKIGLVFYYLLEKFEVKIIIRKKPWFRSEKEIDFLIRYLQKLDLFKDHCYNISYFGYRDLTRSLEVKTFAAGDNIYSI